MRNTHLVLSFFIGVTFATPALAQKSSDPNMGHFYMGRQEWTIEDQGPVINDKRTGGQPGGTGGFAGNGPPAALPKSGWQPYSSTIPSVRNALPKVENGVPKPAPLAPIGAHGKAGNLKPKHAAAVSPAPKAHETVVRSYTPYSTAPSSASGSSNFGSSATVRGSLLQKLRPKNRSY